MGRMGQASMLAALIDQHRTVERDRMIAHAALDSMLRAGAVTVHCGNADRTPWISDEAGIN